MNSKMTLMMTESVRAAGCYHACQRISAGGGVEYSPKEALDGSGSGLMSLLISSSKSPKLTLYSSSTLKSGSMPSSLLSSAFKR
jgi:hypothetical protein